MPLVDPWPPVRQAMIRSLRANLVLAASLPGGWAEGFVPKDSRFPLGVISLVPSPSSYDWSGVIHDIYVDVVVFAKTSGEAASLDQLVLTTLQDARLQVTGLTSLQCRRMGSISLPDTDSTGNPVFTEGGTFHVRVSQSNPTLTTLTVTADSTIS